jgi:hypothetical protein
VNATQLQKFLGESSLVPFTTGRIEQTAMALRDQNLLPAGGRGLNAPHLKARYIARLLIGLCSPVVASAPDMVRRWGALRADRRKSVTLEESLMQLLCSPRDEQRVVKVTVNTDWPQAEITFAGLAPLKFEIDDSSQMAQAFEKFALCRQVAFEGSFFHQLAIELDDVDDFEWRSDVEA